jgi:hypothetical protein
VARLKKKRKINLKKEKEKSHKITLNALTVKNKDITQRTVIRNLNKTKQLKQRVSLKVKNESLDKKNILEENKIKPDDNLRKRLFLK